MLFTIDCCNNAINEIEKSTFAALHFTERKHLQEWIAKNPSCLCSNEADRLLVIQKEFDGFDGTSERLDLLALDQDGALVVIENKLDDSGRDVVWQVLKYVSYCSTLKSQQIVEIYQQYLDKYFAGENAVDNLERFFNDNSIDEILLNAEDQRIIMVAADYRQEVTSTVMWMLSHGLKVQCFKASPYKMSEATIVLDIEQIIPVKEAEEYTIRLAEKDREKGKEQEHLKGIQIIRQKFWRALLDTYNATDDYFANISPSKDHWLSAGSGVSHVTFTFLATKTMVGIELYIGNPDRAENKRIFDKLYAKKIEIEAAFGGELVWERQDENKRSRIAAEKEGLSVKDETDWPEMIEYLCTTTPRFIQSLKQSVNEAARS